MMSADGTNVMRKMIRPQSIAAACMQAGEEPKVFRFTRHNVTLVRGCLDKALQYDFGMTKSKIAISLPKDQIARIHREVRAGRAGSVSGYIAQVLAEHERSESLRELLRDLIEQHGEPAAKDIKWAERALEQRQA